MTTEQPTPLIFSKMVAIMQSIGTIGKAQKNTFHNYQYRGIDDIYNALGPIMSEAGVFMTSDILDHTTQTLVNAKGEQYQDHAIVIEYTFWATDGSHISTVVVGEGADKGDKAVYKALAGAHKYALLQTFIVPTADVKDAEANSPDLTGDKPRSGPTSFVQPAENTEDGTVSGLIDKFSKKATKTGGQMWSVEVQGVWVSAFESADGAELEKANRGNIPVGITYSINGKYRNVITVALLGQPEEEEQQQNHNAPEHDPVSDRGHEPPAHTDDEVPF